MVLREDLWTHDTCLVCQSIHSTESDKQKHEQEETHNNKIVVYDFLSRELSCLTASTKPSILYQRYYRANAIIAGLDCICELNFSWSQIPFWACTICYVAGKTLESVDEHMYSSFHRRNYMSEYHPERYATLLRTQEKSSKDKLSLLEHEAILEILHESKGLVEPNVYEISERDQQWAYQKLGLEEGESTNNYIVEDISDNHQIVLCNICGETFMAFTQEEKLREAWFTHLSTSIHQRCKFMKTLLSESKLEQCLGAPLECNLRKESKFEQKTTDDICNYGPTVGLEFLVKFAGSEESFCQLCFCCFQNSTITEHFSSEYHVERFMKRESPSKLLNSEYLKLEEILEILTFSFDEKPVTEHRYYQSQRQIPLLLKNYQFPEHRTIIIYAIEEIDLGHDIRAIWCENCKEYVHIPDSEAWNIHIFEDPHFEQTAKKALHYIGNEGLVRSSNKLDDFSRTGQPIWEDQYSLSLGLLTTQNHCEYGLQFIVKDKLKKRLFCTCCFLECEEGDAEMFSLHARSLQHITRAMHSMNMKTMITLGFRFTDVNQRKPLVLDYLKYSKMNRREKQLGISLYDPVTACRLNCMGGIPKVFLELIKIAPDERMDFLNKWKAKMVTENEQFVSINAALRICKIVVIWEKELITFHCEGCIQTFISPENKIVEYLTEHLLGTTHWKRTKILDESPFDENCRLTTKVSKIAVPPFQQIGLKKITWKWNDKKACYEFVYSQLGLRDIRERRNFHGATKPDMFCTLCAQSFKANRIDLEQHIRSFSHIFYYMQKYQTDILPELQAELLNTELIVVEKHKNIRRLFARAMKGNEKSKPDEIPIYDFEAKECEYADVKKALDEDLDNEVEAHQEAPKQQSSITNIFDPSEANNKESKLLDLGVLRHYGNQKQKSIKEIIENYELLIEATNKHLVDGTKCDEAKEFMQLENAQRELLNVIHFDGLVETEGASTIQQNENTPTTSRNQINPQQEELISTVLTVSDNSKEADSNTSKTSTTENEPTSYKHHTKPRHYDRNEAHSNKSSNRYSRPYSRSPPIHRRNRSKKRQFSDKFRPPPKRVRSRSRQRQRPDSSAEKQRHDEKERIEKHRSKSKSPVKSPESSEPIVYTSYAKRLADLKTALLVKGGTKNLNADDPNLFFFTPNRHVHIDRNKVTDYITKEASTIVKTSAPKEQKQTEAPEEVGGFFRYIPPPPPSYTQKNIGGAYDPEYLEKTYPHLLRKDVSPPRGNLDDLTSEKVRRTSSQTQYSSSKSTDRDKSSFTESSNISTSQSTSINMTSKDTEKRSRPSRTHSRGKRGKKKSRHIWEENSSDATETSDSESSSSDSSNERGKAIKKQQLLNRLMIDKQKGIGGKKIQMHIPKELPAFKIQALRRQKSQKINAKKNSIIKMEQEEVEELEAISPEPEEESPSPAKSPTRENEQLAQKTQQQPQPRSSRWDAATKSFVLLDESSNAGQQQPAQPISTIEPPRLLMTTVQPPAPNILSQVAASTAAFTAKQLAQTNAQSIPTSTPIINVSTLPTSSVHLFAPPPQQQYITSTVGTLPLQMTSTSHLSMSTPLPGSQPLPSQLLGALTSALGLRPPFMQHTSTSHFPIHPQPLLNMNQPPPMFPSFNQPPPMIDRIGFEMRTKMEKYAVSLQAINTIKDLIEFMWRQGYDPIPPTDPPLLFNEVLKKRKGLIGASTLYQIICYGHPELETYYCGMCNHWTTVSEMFMHLQAPMHQLNYMFRNYKMYHRKAIEETDEQRRDMMLHRFSLKIWEVENCGQCTNRMRCILNEEAIRRIWPEYINCLDNSWKIMDDDDIEFLNAYHKNPLITNEQDHANSNSRPTSVPQSNQQDSTQPQSQTQLLDQESVRAASASIKASIVAKKLELSERAGLAPPGLVDIKSEKRTEDEWKKLQEEKQRAETDKRRERRRSRSPKRSRSRARTHRSRSKSRSSLSKTQSKEKVEERQKGSRRQSRSRSRGGRHSRRSKSRSPYKKADERVNNREKSSDKHKEPSNKETTAFAEKMASFLHKVGANENTSKQYWQNEQQANKADSVIVIDKHSNKNVKTAQSLAGSVTGSGESLQKHTQGRSKPNREPSPVRPSVTPLNQGGSMSKQQVNARAEERQREMEEQKKKKRAIGAMVELQQEYTRNGGYLSAEVFYSTCQEFGIEPDEVQTNDILKKVAAEFQVNIHAAYPTIIKRMRQRGPTINIDIDSNPQTQARQGNTHQQTTIELPSSQFNLQSMGVDPSKLRGLDPRMLQSILNKANTTGGNGGISQQSSIEEEAGSSSRLRPFDIRFNESLAPGNYVYPSYGEEEMDLRQPRTLANDIDSSISQLTYAFQRQQPQMQMHSDSSAEVTLAVHASTRNAPPHGNREMEGMLPKHPQAYVRCPQAMESFEPSRINAPQSGERPSGTGMRQQQGMDFTRDVEIASWKSSIQEPVEPIRNPETNEFAQRPAHQNIPTPIRPPSINQQSAQSPIRPQFVAGPHVSPYSQFQQQPRNTPPPSGSFTPISQQPRTPTSQQPRLGPPPPSMGLSPQQRPRLQQQEQKQMNPNLQKLAMQVGDDWNSLGHSLDSLFGLGPIPSGGNPQQQQKGQQDSKR